MTKLIPHCSPDCIDIIVRLLAYDPDDRLSARQAVKHPYFKDIRSSELKEKQAAQAAGGQGSEGEFVSSIDDRSHVPVEQPRGGRSKKDAGSTSGMLPSIEKGGGTHHRTSKHSKELTGGSGSELLGGREREEDPQPAPQQLPYVHASESYGVEEGGSSTLPPIGGFGTYGLKGTQGGVGALQIDSKSLMGGSKTQNQKAREMRLHGKGPSKKAQSGRPQMVGMGSSVQMQSRSCASCGDVLDFGVGNSSQHTSQPMMEADGMSLSMAGMTKVVGSKKAYQSPYSQRKQKC